MPWPACQTTFITKHCSKVVLLQPNHNNEEFVLCCVLIALLLMPVGCAGRSALMPVPVALAVFSSCSLLLTTAARRHL
jgi:hypothetical protein